MYVLLSPLILPFLFSVSAAGIFGGGSSSYVTCASISPAARSCPPTPLGWLSYYIIGVHGSDTDSTWALINLFFRGPLTLAITNCKHPQNNMLK